MVNLTKSEIQHRYWEKNKEKIKASRKRVEVVCPDCGNTRLCREDALKVAKSNRCSKCSLLNTRREQGDIIHSLSNHPLYIRWMGMKRRVKDVSKATSYLNKGVIVCEEWSANFLSFYEWSITNGFSTELELDRIDNDGDYCPENCRWVSHRENCLNR